MSDTDGGDLIVISGPTDGVRQGKQLKQRFCLRADPAQGNHIILEWHACRGIDDLYRLSQSICCLGEVSVSFCQSWRQPRLSKCIAVAHPLIVNKEIGPILEQMGNLERAA